MPNYQASLDRVFWALGDPTRFAIVEQLARQPASVSDLARPFNLSLPTFMQHLGVLEECGLVTSEKTGRVRMCSLNKNKLEEVDAWISAQKRLWTTRFDALDKLLENDK